MGAGALRRSGYRPSAVAETLHSVTEAPASTSHLVILLEKAKNGRPRCPLPAPPSNAGCWHTPRRQCSPPRARLPLATPSSTGRARKSRLLLDDAWASEETLHVAGIRFREFAKMATGRRFSAGLFHWDICGVSRSWLLKVPPRDVPGLVRALTKLRGLGPVMFPHLNPHRLPGHLAEPAISDALAAMAETLESRPDLRGLVAASWLRSPDVHRVSPHLAAVNAPIVAAGGFVTTVGTASPDCGIFERSRERARLYREGRLKPTTGLVIWPRADMLRWWRSYKVTAKVSSSPEGG